MPDTVSNANSRHSDSDEYSRRTDQDTSAHAHALPRVDHRDANAHHAHHATDFHAVPAGRMPNADA